MGGYEMVKRLLTDMTERRVTEVVSHASGFNHFRIQAAEFRLVLLLNNQLLGEPSAHLGDLKRVLLARVENATLTSADNLRNAREPVESGGIQNAITVPLELRSLISTLALVPARRA